MYSAMVVPGDICILKTGDTVPADMRMTEVMNLYCDEKSLTGESEPVEKVTAPSRGVKHESEVALGDRTCVAHATTPVTKGRGKGVIIFTGMETEVGKIAAGASGKKARKPGRSMNTKYGPMQPIKGVSRRTWDVVGGFLGITEGTPLQRTLSWLAYVLLGAAIVLAMIVFAVNDFHVTGEVAIYAISTGIAIIPESLIAYAYISTPVLTVLIYLQRPHNYYGCWNECHAKGECGRSRFIGLGSIGRYYQHLF